MCRHCQEETKGRVSMQLLRGASMVGIGYSFTAELFSGLSLPDVFLNTATPGNNVLEENLPYKM